MSFECITIFFIRWFRRSKALLTSGLIQSMCEKELRPIKESQDFASEQSIVSGWRKESNWAPILPAWNIKSAPNKPFSDKRAHLNLQGLIADSFVWTITSSLTMPLLLVPQIGKQLATLAASTPILI